MTNPTTFNSSKVLEEIRAKEKELQDLDNAYNKAVFELQELKRINAANITIPWKESIKTCLIDEKVQSTYFLKTPAFIANCVAWTYGVEVTRDIKNKVATTLSIMFNNGEIGRIQHKGKTYYGEAAFFKTDMVTLKREFADWVEDLMQ